MAKASAGACPLIRWGDDPPHDGYADGQQSQERCQVEDKSQRTVHRRRKRGEADAGEYAMEKELPVGRGKDQERPEDHGVVGAERPVQDPLLAEGVRERRADAAAGRGEPVILRTERDQAQTPVAAPEEQDEGSRQKW